MYIDEQINFKTDYSETKANDKTHCLEPIVHISTSSV